MECGCVASASFAKPNYASSEASGQKKELQVQLPESKIKTTFQIWLKSSKQKKQSDLLFLALRNLIPLSVDRLYDRGV